MARLTREFFGGGEVLFVGYSSRNAGFSRKVYEAITAAGIRVYPLNPKGSGDPAVKVYRSLDELPAVPAAAYVLLGAGKAGGVVRELAARGVKRVLFHIGKTADAVVLAECRALGMETAVACPLMLFGGGIHWLHGWLAGVRR
ncbi:CoA-binding protein [Anaeroselena agilis]|uniref:CoA-binding protein n=1 Tax=Anaeroselena agilis TaxID=3063788 RepID=A0ABU3P3L0_9FIRM|nr:CoA-binding protein [Selenomonadales bacterium 4137-cl]